MFMNDMKPATAAGGRPMPAGKKANNDIFILVCGKWDLNKNVMYNTFCTSVYDFLSRYLEGFMAIVCVVLDFASIIKFRTIYNTQNNIHQKNSHDKRIRRQEKLMLIQVKWDI